MSANFEQIKAGDVVRCEFAEPVSGSIEGVVNCVDHQGGWMYLASAGSASLQITTGHLTSITVLRVA